jgi:hypothetical protein
MKVKEGSTGDVSYHIQLEVQYGEKAYAITCHVPTIERAGHPRHAMQRYIRLMAAKLCQHLEETCSEE